MKQRGSAGKRIAAIVAIAAVVILLMTPSVQSVLEDIITSPFKPRYPEEASFTLKRTLTVDAGGGTVKSFNIDMPEPMNIVENGNRMQTINSVEYSVDVAHTIRYGHNWTVWSDDVPFSGRRTITVTYDVTARTVLWDIDATTSGNISDIPEALKEQYLRDEWKMTPDHPDVGSLSREIVGGERNVYLVLQSIYGWMRDNVKYPISSSSGSPQTALETMESRVGDCDDQSILFCSLARAAGVPAWLQLGALYVGIEDNWGGHAWLQACVPLKSGGYENVVIDPVNGEFLVWRPNRFVEFTDDGNATHLVDYYYIYNASIVSGTNSVLYDSYEALSYEESERKVSQGSVFVLGVRPPGMCLVPLRT